MPNGFYKFTTIAKRDEFCQIPAIQNLLISQRLTAPVDRAIVTIKDLSDQEFNVVEVFATTYGALFFQYRGPAQRP